MRFFSAFPATFTPDPDGGFVITFRDLPEAITQGETESQCFSEASDCLAEALAARIDDSQDIPIPTAVQTEEYLVSVPLEMAWKAEVYTAMRRADVPASQLAHILNIERDKIQQLLAPSNTVDQTLAKQVLQAIS